MRFVSILDGCEPFGLDYTIHRLDFQHRDRLHSSLRLVLQNLHRFSDGSVAMAEVVLTKHRRGRILVRYLEDPLYHLLDHLWSDY